MAKKIESYRDLDYNKVVDWADKKGLNTDTPENWKEAAKDMFSEMQTKKKKRKTAKK